MASKLPYMSAPGAIGKILKKAKVAKTPERFTKDFLKTVLECRRSSDQAFIGFAKRLGLVGSDGVPSDIYKKFRNTDKQSGAAIAQAMKNGFSALYTKNEFAHRLSDPDLTGLVIEITGLDSGNAIVRHVVNSYKELKKLADFETELDVLAQTDDEEGGGGGSEEDGPARDTETRERPGMNLAYNIHLVLPKTDDVAVFNAIFKSLRENLLKP